jgi:nicotinamidase-related amidase
VWRIDPREYARHEARRGRRFAFAELDPRRTALVVIDMVPFHVSDSTYCRAIVPNINLMAEALRAAGGIVAWVTPASTTPAPREIEFFGRSIADTYSSSGGSGPIHTRLWPGMISHSSARDAATVGFRVIMVADANAARCDQDHNAALHTIYRSFGDVRPTEDVLEMLAPTT